jgi:uncharacterized MAPEG superfamily protein
MATSSVDRPRAGDHGLRSGASRLATETKQFFKTSEFFIWLAVTVGILLAANSIEGEEGGVDFFNARHAWLFITILSAAYFVSRGLAKSGTRDPYWEASGDNRNRDGNGQ